MNKDIDHDLLYILFFGLYKKNIYIFAIIFYKHQIFFYQSRSTSRKIIDISRGIIIVTIVMLTA